MKVELKLFATLARYLPQSGSATVEVPEGYTAGQLLRSLGIPDELPAVVLINGSDASAEQVLQDGDVLTVFPPLAGGSSRGVRGPFAFRTLLARPLTAAARPVTIPRAVGYGTLELPSRHGVTRNGSAKDPGGPPGLQIRRPALDKLEVGSTPTRFRQLARVGRWGRGDVHRSG